MKKVVYWALFEKEQIGTYLYTENSNADTVDHTFNTEKELRQHLQRVVENYGLLHFSPDIAANPLEIDVICADKVKTDIFFSDGTKLSSAHRFQTGHEQVVQLRLQNLATSGGGSRKDWLIASDHYQITMLRRSIIKNIYQENSHVMFSFIDGRPDYLSDWENTSEATKKLAEFKAQFENNRER